MIHILSTVSAGAEQNPLIASSGGDASASFMALFAQALTQGAAGEPAGVLSALAGHGQKAAASDDGKAADAPASVAVTAEAAATEAVAGDAPAAAVEASLMAMLGLPVPVTATVPAATTAMTAEQSVQAAAPGAEPPDALLVDVDGDTGGKKLPNPLAVIAGQQKSALIQVQAQAEVAKADSAKVDPLPHGLLQDAPSALSVLSAAKEAAPTLAASDAVATPVSGQEAALITARGHAAAAPQGKVVIGMNSGFGTPAWQQELGDKIVWLAGRQGQMAELVLNPPSLGAVEVRLNLSGSEATAQFFSANPHVRDVIEAALPRLRELMVGAGLSLGEAMVSDQSFGQRDKTEQQARASGQGGLSVASATEDGQVTQSIRISGTSLLDYFA